MILIGIVGIVLLRVAYCGLEVYFERDWPRSTWRGLIISLCLLFMGLSAFGQNTRWDLPVYTVQAQGGNLLPVYAIPGAKVIFYSCSGSICSNLATTYISATSATTCPTVPTPAQIVLNGTSACVSSADPYGNMGGWFQSGQYMATITAQGSSYNYYFTIGGSGGGSFGGFTYDASSNTSTLTSNLALGSVNNVAFLGEGESTMAGNTLLYTAATLGVSSNMIGGPNGSQDLMSDLMRKSNFAGRVLFYKNGAQGGTNCAQMAATYTAQNYAKYAPGGSFGLPAAGTAYDLIWTGKNDESEGTSLASYTSCINNHLLAITAVGFTPVLLTSYYSNSLSDPANVLLKSYNDFLRAQQGKIINGKTVRVFDIDGQFLPSSQDATYEVILNPFPGGTAYTISSYQITRTGSAPNFTSTITLNINPATSTGTTSFIGTCPEDPANLCGALLFGGFETSTYLNFQKATYVSGTGTNTIVATLAFPFPSTGLVTELGKFGSWYIPNPAGLHFGAQGYDNVASYINNTWGISGIAGSNLHGSNNNYSQPMSGVQTIAGAVCVRGASSCPGLNPGDISATETPQVGTTGTAPFQAATGKLVFGAGTYLLSQVGQVTLQGGNYTGPSGGLGGITPCGGSAGCGTNYKIGDAGTVASGTGGTYTVTAVVVGGACTTLGTTTGPVCTASVTAGGTGYTPLSGVSTTATTGSGSGMTVSTFPSVSQIFKVAMPGMSANGSIYAIQGSVPNIAPDGTGVLGSFTPGGITNFHLVLNAFGSAYTTNDVVTVVQTGASAGTFTVTANTTGAATVTLTGAGTGYSTAILPTTCSGSETGLQVEVVAAGAISGLFIANPGDHATAGDTCSIVQGGASGGTFTIATTANGQVINAVRTTPGTNYISAPTLPVIGGTGTGFQISIGVAAGAVIFGNTTQGIFDTGAAENWRPSGPVNLNNTFQATGLIGTVAAPTVSAGQIGYGSTVVANTFCGTLAGSAGCIVVNIAGTVHYVPYY